MTAFTPVDAPPIDRPVVNLLAAARTPTGENVRWQEGSVYESLACGQVSTRDTCDPSVVELVKAGVGSDDPDGRRVETVAVYAEALYECMALPALLDTYRDRALATLDAELPRAVEHELWTGAIARGADLPNRYLIDPDRVSVLNGGVAVKPSAALGLLETALGDVYGGVGLIHCNRHAQVYLPTVTRTGRILETRVGNRVVPGVGYPGTGPDALTAPVPNAAATATTGGTLVADTYEYVITATNAEGESVPSAQVARVVPAGTATNTVTLTWPAVTGATGYKVYGRQAGSLGLLGSPAGATFTDTGAGAPGAAPPTEDTSARPPAGTEWLYITPMVTVRLGVAEVLDRPTVDPGTNRAQIRARQPFEVSWDGCASAFAILMQTVVEATP